MKRIIEYVGRDVLGALMIALISFAFLSYVRYPALNSDHAVIVLQAQEFTWPQDAYFWGQDRYGSVVQLIIGH